MRRPGRDDDFTQVAAVRYCRNDSLLLRHDNHPLHCPVRISRLLGTFFEMKDRFLGHGYLRIGGDVVILQRRLIDELIVPP